MNDNIKSIKKNGFRILLIFVILELIFHFSSENFIGCLLSIYAWLLLCTVVLSRKSLEKCLLPTICVSGYIFCYYFMPLIATFIEGKPLTYNFEVPYLTFFNMFLNVTCIVLAFVVCKMIYRQDNWLQKIWMRCGYFIPPKEKQIWLWGIIGCILIAISMWTQTEGLDIDEMQTSTDAAGVLQQTFTKYAALPICLYFPFLYGYKKQVETKKLVIFFLLVMSLIGIATTKRSMIFNAFASLGVIYIFVVIYQNRKVMSTRNMILVCLGLYLITGPAADLALAMALNRSNMQGGGKTFGDVISLYQDKDKMSTLRSLAKMTTANGGNNSMSWSEEYVDNIFLDRFCNIRVLDASVYYAGELGYNNPRMHKYFKEEIINNLFSPIVNAIGEKKVAHTTVADEMNTTYFSSSHFITGWKVTGDIGAGLYTFGYFYYPFAFIIYLLVFLMFSTYTRFKNGSFIIPVPILTTFLTYFMYFDNAYGIYSSISHLMRDWIGILVFCLIYKCIRVVLK